MPEKKKNIMRAFKMTEISGVDSPAQKGARVLIMKRMDDEYEMGPDGKKRKKKKPMMGKGYDNLFDVLTNEVNGHQHGIKVYMDGDEGMRIRVDYATGDGEEHSHDHPVVRSAAGSFTFGVVNGHTHTIDTAALNEKLLSTMTKGEDKTMLDKTPTAEELQTQLTTEKAAHAKANKIIALSADERAHFEKLDDTGKDTFLAKSLDDRKTEINLAKSQAADADPVVYKTLEGIEIRKSAGDTVIALAKSNDDKERRIVKLTVERDSQVLEKRAQTELPNMGGDVKDRGALLKSVDGIEDETTRKSVMALLKGADASMSKMYKQIGVGGEADLTESSEAEDKLEKLAKQHAEKNDVSFAKAYKAVLNTTEGKDLYNQTLN